MLGVFLKIFRKLAHQEARDSTDSRHAPEPQAFEILYEPVPDPGFGAEFDPKYDDWKDWPTPDWNARRKKVIDGDGGICQAPGCLCKHGLDVHHAKERSKGGNHKLENLVTLCRVHHAFVHLSTNKIEVPQENCSIVCRHLRNGIEVRACVRRFILIRPEELKAIRTHFRLMCQCGEEKWEGHLCRKTIWTWCPKCNGRWEFDIGIVEETGVHLALAFPPLQNAGRFKFHPDLIQGLKKPTFAEGCPWCLRDGTRGYLVEGNLDNLRCSEYPMCKYSRPVFRQAKTAKQVRFGSYP